VRARLIPGIFVLVMILTGAHAEISGNQLKKLESYKGSYKVLGGSNKKCAPGRLNIVGDESEKGIRIGHDIFLGPFKGSVEKGDQKNCRVKVDFEMKDDHIVVKTNVDKCPNKKEEGRTTQYLIFKKDKVEYRVAETEHVCYFGKVSEVQK